MVQKKSGTISGTKEWADKNYNCFKGCEHDCLYCYARRMAKRGGRIKSDAEWTKQKICKDKVAHRMGKIAEQAVMFPTTHDITPKTLAACTTVLQHLLNGGNRVLVVSKPHLDCIKTICKTFADHRDMILFRFTIGAYDDTVLKYWEPHAPAFKERLASLKHAFKRGFETSVSIEPMLDSKNVVKLFHMLEPWVTDAIWIGKMNGVPEKAGKQWELAIRAGQTDAKIAEIYAALKKHPKVKWKDSIKNVVGLEMAQKAGLDV
jgi:DNA repair photolyase